jgi:hypothetical protein
VFEEQSDDQSCNSDISGQYKWSASQGQEVDGKSLNSQTSDFATLEEDILKLNKFSIISGSFLRLTSIAKSVNAPRSVDLSEFQGLLSSLKSLHLSLMGD